MFRILKQTHRFIPKAMQGDPTALTALAVIGAIAAGKYVYDKIKEDIEFNKKIR